MAGITAILASPSFAQSVNLPDEGGIFSSDFEILGDSPFGQESTGDPVQIEAKFIAAPDGRRGQLSIKATIAPNWHIYSLTQGKDADGGGPQPTLIELEPSAAYRRTGPFQANPAPERHTDDEIWIGLTIEEHHGQVIWTAPVEFAPAAANEAPIARGIVKMQPCNPSGCRPTDISFEAVAAPGELIPLAPVQERSVPETPIETAPEFEPVTGPAPEPDTGNDSLAWMLVFGFVGGIILNIMPCVLPVIGLKIFAFIEQAGESRAKTFALNFWYAVGVISIFMVLALLAAMFQLGWGQLFQLKEFNIVMAAVIFAMGLSFLGVWEIPIPGFVGTSQVTQIGEREGYEGAFVKGAITTILATPCTGPFMGTAIAGVVSRPAPEIFAIFFAIGLGMASPYLIIGAFPELVRFLPKPGEWMNTFKQVMGFVLLGTVAFILTSLRPFYLVVPTIAFLFGMWLCCWWIGRVPPTAESKRRWLAFGESIFIGVIVGLVAFGWLSPIMEDRHDNETKRMADAIIEKWADEGLIAYSVRNEPWQPYTERKLKWLEDANETALVDFTADWCQTCKFLEKIVLKTESTSKLIKELEIYTLVADWTEKEAAVEVDKKLKE
ncbi:MAG: thioredoxin family protein, partial [Pirellulales bacterium]|nr:thioredoxin family protein [Pirellulales bacterium]